MTELIVTPLDYSAPGSFRKRSKMMRALAMMRGNPGIEEMAAAYVIIEDLVLERVTSDDGTPVEEILDQLSAVQFDELLSAIAGENAVPTESAES